MNRYVSTARAALPLPRLLLALAALLLLSCALALGSARPVAADDDDDAVDSGPVYTAIDTAAGTVTIGGDAYVATPTDAGVEIDASDSISVEVDGRLFYLGADDSLLIELSVRNTVIVMTPTGGVWTVIGDDEFDFDPMGQMGLAAPSDDD